MSSAVTPSDSACHPSDACQSRYSSDACQSRYSSGRSQAGLPPPLPPLVRSEPRFRPSVLPAPSRAFPITGPFPGSGQYHHRYRTDRDIFGSAVSNESVVPRRPTPERVLSPVPANTTIDIEPIVISSVQCASTPSRKTSTLLCLLLSVLLPTTPLLNVLRTPRPAERGPSEVPEVIRSGAITPCPAANASPAAPTRANPFPASRYFHLPNPRYPTDPNDPALRELFPNEDDGVFDAIPADAVEAALVDIQGRFETILSASVLPPSLRRSTYAAFLSKIRELRRHRLQVMAVFNPSLAAYPDGNGDGPALNSGSS
ncbi:uncharacterized protein PGTG_02805 [Puccinia graminis f. sp. tritici CRL 75-36-700-3]|uniref:Uncharacterized protein n=1 Tax=Puccinia graminis f. sp. tritici (strain CRL 75-36-700-3 / race SCCL) TaxID=418459 RepID=E3JWD9_PUCGT|nr:uncharacterized protein PGTG_02805 [Puccinia graminis f. sp. tritici CRL 75-36-700-3]EFP76364.2 hypothetical protein PGTG_02805 [Puccinia graminis f. sp. tritici CRL 75-36-700-3]